jgi:hypothetical protein
LFGALGGLEKQITISFQMTSASICKQSKRLFKSFAFIALGKFASFFLFSSLNLVVVTSYKISLKIDESAKFLVMINELTFWVFEIINSFVLFVVYLRFDIVKKFLTSSSAEENRCSIRNLRAVSGILDATCDAMESIKFCFLINMINYVIQYTFMLTYS